MARFVSYTKCTLCRAFFQFVDAYRLQQEAGATCCFSLGDAGVPAPLHTTPALSGVAGGRLRPPASSTPPPPLREVQVYTGSSSGLTINLPLKAPLSPLRG